MSMTSEFKAFITKGNVVDLAVAVVIGAAFSKIVTAMVEGLIMPIVGKVMPGGDWRAWDVTPVHLKLGGLIGAIVDFLLIALVVFLVFVKGLGALQRKEAAAPTTKDCSECLEKIPLAAKRCKACASPQP